MSQIIKTLMVYDKETEDNKERILLITKDDDGKKKHTFIEDPVIEYYITKPEHRGHGPISFIEQDKVDRYISTRKNLIKDMVNNLGDSQIYNDYQKIIKSGHFSEMKKLKDIHLNENIHGSDINIEDFYIASYIRQNGEIQDPTVHKLSMDIEVDATELGGAFPDAEEAEAPVNLISGVDHKTNTVYVYILNYPEVESFNQAMERLPEIEKEIKDRYKKEENMDVSIEWNRFDDEAELIISFLDKVNNELKTDFNIAYNLAFDFVTLYNRLEKLGYDPNTHFSSEDIEYKKAFYKLDTMSVDIADKRDRFETASYGQWVDLLVLYANITKPLGRLASYSLDFVAEHELGYRKDEFEGSIADIHIRDYERFLKYNIQDTILTMLLEERTKYVELLYSIAQQTRTRVEVALQKTVCLRNMMDSFARDKGMYISNNRSRLKNQGIGDSKIKGGFVGDPNLIDYVGKKIIDTTGMGNDRSKFIFENVSDFDLTSLYPSILSANNISEQTYVNTLSYHDEDGRDITPEFIDDYTTGDSIAIFTKYLDMPDTTLMVDEASRSLDNGETRQQYVDKMSNMRLKGDY